MVPDGHYSQTTYWCRESFETLVLSVGFFPLHSLFLIFIMLGLCREAVNKILMTFGFLVSILAPPTQYPILFSFLSATRENPKYDFVRWYKIKFY